MNPPDRTKTLDELEPPAWGEPESDSYLVTTCHRLRSKPIGEFSVEDLRVMIGQGIGLEWLIPLALERLDEDPLAEGDFYPGDLLACVLGVEDDFWAQRSESRDRVRASLMRLGEVPDELSESVARFIEGTR